MNWAAVLGALTEGDDLSVDVAHEAMAEILAGEATSAQIAGFAIALRMKGETVDELRGLLQAMVEAADPVVLDPSVQAIDTCGTGGDRSGTVNISSVAAFVVAGAGVPVCKHGNRAASSQCGSADVYEALGVPIDLDPEAVARAVTDIGMGFCFAQRFHAALRHAGPTRKELGVRTAFNFLGPMANPARVRRQVVGVSDPRMAERMLRVLVANGAERPLVVYGHDGLDELTTTTTSTLMEWVDGEVRTHEVDATAFGLARAEPTDLLGGDATVNAEAARRVLAGESGAHRDIVVLNAAAGLLAGGAVDDLAAGVQAAQACLDDGRAAGVLDRLRRFS
ncbi:MAG TPA: anthranilate phosphoribosyltransferase [Acidimicrobiales bacterium]|nr:anthranilate phosphoribosyltransferase [Acidimicrobiales bacterium]